MKSGRTLWDELCLAYERGCRKVQDMQREWAKAEPYVAPELYKDIEERLTIQARDAQWWKDGCLLYFQQFSGMPFPDEVTPAVHSLEELREVSLPITNFESPSKALLNSVR